jgi:hypothetical protein
MDNIPAPENITSQEKVSKKSPLIKIIVPLILLVVLGVLGFVFEDRILEYFGIRKEFSQDINKNSTSEESPFSILAGNTISENDKKLLRTYAPGESEVVRASTVRLFTSPCEGGEPTSASLQGFRCNPGRQSDRTLQHPCQNPGGLRKIKRLQY